MVNVQVLSNIAQRMQHMHESGYVHMDLKPGNVILLPRCNKWTVIDFGCSAKIGTHAPLAFTATYCPPEVIHAAEGGRKSIMATPAMDVWALGVMSFELLTGAPAFRVISDGMGKVRMKPSIRYFLCFTDRCIACCCIGLALLSRLVHIIIDDSCS